MKFFLIKKKPKKQNKRTFIIFTSLCVLYEKKTKQGV
jgi:hypothetical protein